MSAIQYIETRCPACDEIVTPVVSSDDPYVLDFYRTELAVRVRAVCSKCGGMLGMSTAVIKLHYSWEWKAEARVDGEGQ